MRTKGEVVRIRIVAGGTTEICRVLLPLLLRELEERQKEPGSGARAD